MDNFEELKRKMHQSQKQSLKESNSSFISELTLMLSNKENNKLENEKYNLFFNIMNSIPYFKCKNGIIKFENKNQYNADELKVIFDTVVDLFKYHREGKVNAFNYQLNFIKEYLRENLKDIEK